MPTTSSRPNVFRRSRRAPVLIFGVAFAACVTIGRGAGADAGAVVGLFRLDRAAEVPELKNSAVIAHGMIPKVDSAVAAIESGVEKVQFVDGRIPHSVLLEIFTDAGVGTEVVL